MNWSAVDKEKFFFMDFGQKIKNVLYNTLAMESLSFHRRIMQFFYFFISVRVCGVQICGWFIDVTLFK